MEHLRLVDTSGSVCLVAPGQPITPSMRAAESRLGVRFRHGTVAELAAEAIRRAAQAEAIGWASQEDIDIIMHTQGVAAGPRL